MSLRSVLAAGLLFVLLGLYHAGRLVFPGVAQSVRAAPPCPFLIEVRGLGIECRQILPKGCRAGDRVDAQGRVLGRMAPEALDAFEVALDLNRASAEELAMLPGIGPALAERIVKDRARKGPFRRTEDLGRVTGIGERLLARVRDRLVVEPAEATGP
jgi:competence ComEA-like helix-hairpin-helix protein